VLRQVIITLPSSVSRLEQMRGRENSGRIILPKLGGAFTDFRFFATFVLSGEVNGGQKYFPYRKWRF
jgi:hypothetical protein